MSDKVPDPHSVGAICNQNLGVFTVTEIAMENTLRSRQRTRSQDAKSGVYGGHRQLVASGQLNLRQRRWNQSSLQTGIADFGPDLEFLDPGSSVFGGSDIIAAKMEEVVDLVVGREEPLRLAGRFELLHLPLSAARRLVRVFRSVVQPLVLAMLNARHDLSSGRAVAGKLVGDHDAWWPHLLLQQFAQQPLGRFLVASALNQDIEHDPGLVHGAPQPMLHTGDLYNDLVEMPFVADAREPATDSVRERLAKFARPLPHRFVANSDAASGQQLLDHPQPEREPEIQPDGVANDLAWEPITGIASASRCHHATRLPIPMRYRKPASC
jgi:hypothetical protein